MPEKASSPLEMHTGLGYRIRKGGWRDHETSSYVLAEQAIAENRFEDACELGRYTIREALEAHELYRDWLVQTEAFLLAGGVGEDIVNAEQMRVAELLKLPNGASFDAEAGWQQYTDEIERFADACSTQDADGALSLLEKARKTWRLTHDRKHDWLCFLITFAAEKLGEDQIGPLWDVLLAPSYKLYERYDVDNNPWDVSAELLVQIMAEALRGHLSGPGRRGDIEFIDEGHRVGFRFAPCGSGGRTYQDDPDDDVGPRMGPPYNFGVTREKHDWAWNKTGICYYCAHCCAAMELEPIKMFGYPARVVDPPSWPEAQSGANCTWWVYTDPREVPDEIYQRVGREKPKHIGGTAARNRGEET
jgi:hypothetical protein